MAGRQIFVNILDRNIEWPAIPEDMSEEARDLIERLLAEDPDQRLGSMGAAEVKRHPFFNGVDWSKLLRLKVGAAAAAAAAGRARGALGGASSGRRRAPEG